MNDQGQPLDGYTVRVRSANNNAEITQNLFYFTPFSLNSPADASAVSTNYPNFDFSVNKQRLNLQTNLTKYQVLIRKIEENGAGAWETYLDAVPVDHDGVYETTELYVTYSENSSRISVYSKLRPLQGAYEWKIAALDKEDHVQETETRKLYVNTSIPERITSSFPLTILSISGVKNVNLSTYNLVTIQNTYFTQSPNPVIYGIAYVNANVALTLTDRKCLSTSIDQSLCTKSYSTVANQDSRYGINIPSGDLRAGTLYTANASVSLHDFYNQLPPFTLVRGSVGN